MNSIKIIKTTVEESKVDMDRGFEAIEKASRTQLTDALMRMACAYVEEIDPSCDEDTNFITALAMVEGFLNSTVKEQSSKSFFVMPEVMA